ncbi:MAG: hypothetical protein DHS20C18_23770 [Saprospiraceae bacterium]|nr:MAG: hypothetical protein DHS20C18_23770 [Saprospiraceae bacterium]
MRLLYIFLISSISLVAIGQKETPKEIDWEIQELVRCGKAGNVVILTDRENFAGRVRFELINAQNEVIAVEELDLRNMELFGQFESAFFWNGKFTVLTSLFYPGPQRNHLLLRQFLLPDFEEVNSQIIDEAYTPDRFRIPFGHSLSPDSSKIVFYSWSYALKEGSARVVAKVLNKNLEPLWQEKYILPYDNRRLYVYKCLLDNAGHAYLFCEYYQGALRSTGMINPAKIDHFMLRLEQGAKSMRQYSLEVPDKSISNPVFKMQKDGKLYGAAFLKPKNKNKIEGLLFIDIEASSGDLHQKLIPLSQEVFDLAYAKGKKEKFFNPQRFSFRYYQPDHLMINEDGSFMIVAEQRPVIEDLGDPLQNNDILILRLTPRKILDWLVRIPKRQNAFDQGITQLGYGVQAINDTLFLFYNDEKFNHKKDRSEILLRVFKPYEPEEPVAVMAILDPNGQYQETILFPAKGVPPSMRMLPQKVWLKSERTLVIYAEMASGLKTFGFLYPLKPIGE